MSDQRTIQTKMYEQVRRMVDGHDGDITDPAFKPCPYKLKAQGVQTSYFDIQRIGWDELEVVYPSKGIRVHAGAQVGVIHVMCECQRTNNDHDLAEVADDGAAEGKVEVVEERELVRVGGDHAHPLEV